MGSMAEWRGRKDMSRITRTILVTELAVLFLFIPFAIFQQWLPVPLVIIPVYVAAIYAVIWLRSNSRQHSWFWMGDDDGDEKAALKIIALRLPFVVLLALGVVYVFFPERLFVFPADHPFMWLLFLLLYPPLSVYPQEILYRTFFFQRYAAIFPDKTLLIIASTLFFAFMHIVFGNGIVILSTLIGGYFFADTYSRTRSLRMVCLEHSLYGYVVFTVGLGGFFMFGDMKSLVQ
jgi:membrane protease YdiL (CAAX protease family)